MHCRTGLVAKEHCSHVSGLDATRPASARYSRTSWAGLTGGYIIYRGGLPAQTRVGPNRPVTCTAHRRLHPPLAPRHMSFLANHTSRAVPALQAQGSLPTSILPTSCAHTPQQLTTVVHTIVTADAVADHPPCLPALRVTGVACPSFLNTCPGVVFLLFPHQRLSPGPLVLNFMIDGSVLFILT